MTKSLTKKIVTLAIAVCLLLVGVCTFAACGKTKVEGVYTVSQVTFKTNPEEEATTYTVEKFNELKNKQDQTEEEQMVVMMLSMMFNGELELKKDKTATMTVTIEVPGSSATNKTTVNGTWSQDGETVKVTFPSQTEGGETTEETQEFKFADGLLTSTADEDGTVVVYKKK